ncbi:MAG: InlB B-repeat-containing protein [Bacteroidales bacterium]|nr:InlB B-repeat-containing protein [Bacteroidales bacterium]
MLLLFALIVGYSSAFGQTTATLQITSPVTSTGNLTDNSSNTWVFNTDGTLTSNSSYIQAGTNKSEVSYITLETSAYSSKKITRVQVWGTSKANTNVSAKVIIGSTTIGTSDVYTTQNAGSGGTEYSVYNTNSVAGNLKLEISRPSSSTGAIYFNKAIVTYLEPHTITFNGNGGTYNAATSYTQTVFDGEATNLTANQFTYADHNFLGWKDANGTDYTNGQSVTLTANLVLTAQWEAIGSDPYITASDVNVAYTATEGSISYTVNNYQSGTMTATKTADWITIGTVTGPHATEHTGTVPFTMNANTGAQRSATVTLSYDFGGSEPATKQVTVTQAVAQYTVTYDKNDNGASGTMSDDDSPYNYNSTVTVLANGFTAPTGKVFDHWSTASDGGDTYDPGDEFTITGNVTLYAQWRTLTTYSLVTSVDQLISGRHYIIASGATGTVSAMGSQNNGHYRNVVNPVSSNTGVISETEGVYEFVINGPEIITKNNNTVMVYTIYDVTGASGGYLYASNSSSNYMDTQAFNDNNGKWTISIANTGDATIEAQGTNTRYKMRFNNNRFSCYGDNTSVSNLPYLYIKNEVTPQYEFYKDITAHTEATGLGNTDGWYFIASPVNSDNMAPTSVTNMIAETAANYDLYRLSGNMWENYQNDEHTAGFVIANGAGYLYSNASNTTLKFSGTSIKENTDANKTVTPSNTGWNLIGNPFTFPVKVSRTFSELNNGSAVTSKDVNSIINPGAGIAVYGTEVVTFTKYEPEEQSAGPSNINVILAQQVVNRDGISTGSVTLDNAVVSFNEGSILPKFNMLEGNAKLYIPQGTEEYAIVSAEAQGEMPVNFKAAKDGEYTLTVNAEGVEMNYLHLIDNLTGADTDLLATPSYTFNARTTDYASRFRLVISANMVNAEMGEEFAFISNGQLVISNEGEATLQVIDVTGRVVATENINGTCSKAINAKAGVYVLRLINGTDVKTQKIVVR